MHCNNHQQHLYAHYIDLPIKTQLQVIDLLSQTLVSALSLKTQTNQTYRTLKGTDSEQLHKLFEQVSTDLDEVIDLIIIMIAALGGIAKSL